MTAKSSIQLIFSITFVSVFFNSAAASDFKDCYYNATGNHAEYICEGNTGAMFNRRTNEYLFCNNFYSSGIDRNQIHGLSYRNCEENEFLADFFGHFKQLTVLNISFIKLEHIKAADLKHSKYLEVLMVSHNSISKLPADLFGYSAALIFAQTCIDMNSNAFGENCSSNSAVNFDVNKCYG